MPMATPKGACPICWACMQTFRSKDQPELMFVLSDSTEQWNELEELIRVDGPSTPTLHLRAFGVIEWVYLKTIPTLLFAVGRKDIYDSFQNAEVPRSLEGLETLSELLQRARRKSGALRTVLAVKREKTTSAQQQIAMLEKPNKVITACEKSVDVLRTALRTNDTKGLHQIGVLLGDAYLYTATPPATVQEKIKSLLSITTTNPENPWTR